MHDTAAHQERRRDPERIMRAIESRVAKRRQFVAQSRLMLSNTRRTIEIAEKLIAKRLP